MTTAPRRRSKAKGVRVVKAANQAIMLNALTTSLFGTNLVQFTTGKVNGKYNPGADGYQILTLPEIIGFTKNGWNADNVGGNYGTKTFQDTLMYNLRTNGAQAIGTVIAAKAATKVLQKMGVFRDLNSLNRALGVGDLARWS